LLVSALLACAIAGPTARGLAETPSTAAPGAVSSAPASPAMIAGPAAGKPTPAAATANAPAQPTVIESRSLEMRSTDKETIAIFHENVVVTGTNLRLTCDHLEVVASRVGDTSATVAKLDQFKSLVATGRVRIVQGDREVTCGRAEVLPLEEKIILTESPVVIDHSGPYTERGTRIILLRGERRVIVENSVFQGPPIIDLGFDRKEPAAGSKPIADGAADPASVPAPAPKP
jgi:lipopolysaccharide export system protein LptA